MLAILIRPFGFLAPKDFKLIVLSMILFLSVPDDGHSRNVSCALYLISTFCIDKLLECPSVAYILRTDPLTFKGRSSPSQNICFTWNEIRFPVPQFPVENCSVRLLSLFFLHLSDQDIVFIKNSGTFFLP